MSSELTFELISGEDIGVDKYQEVSIHLYCSLILGKIMVNLQKLLDIILHNQVRLRTRKPFDCGILYFSVR